MWDLNKYLTSRDKTICYLECGNGNGVAAGGYAAGGANAAVSGCRKWRFCSARSCCCCKDLATNSGKASSLSWKMYLKFNFKYFFHIEYINYVCILFKI